MNAPRHRTTVSHELAFLYTREGTFRSLIHYLTPPFRIEGHSFTSLRSTVPVSQLMGTIMEALSPQATEESQEAALQLVQAVSGALTRQTSTILPTLLDVAAHPSKQVNNQILACLKLVLKCGWFSVGGTESKCMR